MKIQCSHQPSELGTLRFHFPEVVTEAQRGCETQSKSHSQYMEEQEWSQDVCLQTPWLCLGPDQVAAVSQPSNVPLNLPAAISVQSRPLSSLMLSLPLQMTPMVADEPSHNPGTPRGPP